MWDALWINANLATMAGSEPYGALLDGAIAAQGGKIAFVGAIADLPGEVSTLAREVHDASGAWITPGLIDSHTHVIHGGDSRRDFEMRLRGADRDEIYGSGGGVPGVVRATREASDDTLFQTAARRIVGRWSPVASSRTPGPLPQPRLPASIATRVGLLARHT